MTKYWTRKFYKYAFMFGRNEHFLSRLLFVLLLITFGFHYFQYYDIVYYFLIVDISVWMLYWLMHRIEKWLHNSAKK